MVTRDTNKKPYERRRATAANVVAKKIYSILKEKGEKEKWK